MIQACWKYMTQMLIQTYRIINMRSGLNLLYIIILWGTLCKIFPALANIINISIHIFVIMVQGASN